MAWDTATNIINSAAKELGVKTSALADPYGSTDGIYTQLCALLTALGQDLLRERAWTHLQKTATVSTVNGTSTYALATDYARQINGTQWDRTQQLPLRGPVGAREWQALKARTTAGTIDYVLRVVGNQINLSPTPNSVHTLAYEYVSTYWVQPNGQTAPTSETPSAQDDTLWFDKRLLVCGLKLYFKRAKGFPSDAEQDDYDRALARATGGDGPAPALSLGGGISWCPADGSSAPGLVTSGGTDSGGLY